MYPARRLKRTWRLAKRSAYPRDNSRSIPSYWIYLMITPCNHYRNFLILRPTCHLRNGMSVSWRFVAVIIRCTYWDWAVDGAPQSVVRQCRQRLGLPSVVTVCNPYTANNVWELRSDYQQKLKHLSVLLVAFIFRMQTSKVNHLSVLPARNRYFILRNLCVCVCVCVCARARLLEDLDVDERILLRWILRT
jgi:hypothetical protein